MRREPAPMNDAVSSQPGIRRPATSGRPWVLTRMSGYGEIRVSGPAVLASQLEVAIDGEGAGNPILRLSRCGFVLVDEAVE
jgi:hypothetical protein